MWVTVPLDLCFLVSRVSSALMCLTSKNRIRSACRGVPALANGRRAGGRRATRTGILCPHGDAR